MVVDNKDSVELGAIDGENVVEQNVVSDLLHEFEVLEVRNPTDARFTFQQLPLTVESSRFEVGLSGKELTI